MALEHGNFIGGLVKGRSLTAVGRDKLAATAAQLVSEGQMSAAQNTPLATEVLVAEENLAALREGQIQRLLELRFHEALGKTEEEYRAEIPAQLPQPESYRDRFDLPLIIDPRVALKAQHTAGGVTEYINTGKVTNTTDVPATPYTVWTHDANRYREFSVQDALTRFEADEVASPLIEVTALFLQYPEIFSDHGVDAAGSRSENGNVPYLNTFSGRPKVRAESIGNPRAGWGALSRGNVINVGV